MYMCKYDAPLVKKKHRGRRGKGKRGDQRPHTSARPKSQLLVPLSSQRPSSQPVESLASTSSLLESIETTTSAKQLLSPLPKPLPSEPVIIPRPANISIAIPTEGSHDQADQQSTRPVADRFDEWQRQNVPTN